VVTFLGQAWEEEEAGQQTGEGLRGHGHAARPRATRPPAFAALACGHSISSADMKPRE